jgi:hypothetical protein
MFAVMSNGASDLPGLLFALLICFVLPFALLFGLAALVAWLAGGRKKKD